MRARQVVAPRHSQELHGLHRARHRRRSECQLALFDGAHNSPRPAAFMRRAADFLAARVRRRRAAWAPAPAPLLLLAALACALLAAPGFAPICAALPAPFRAAHASACAAAAAAGDSSHARGALTTGRRPSACEERASPRLRAPLRRLFGP